MLGCCQGLVWVSPSCDVTPTNPLCPGNDHRWTAAWAEPLQMSSFSRSFNYKDPLSWKAKLRDVHTAAWNAWQERLAKKAMYKLKPAEVQQPGMIPENILAELAEAVAEMPPRTKRSKP